MKAELGFHFHGAGHDRRIGSDAELQQILNASMAENDVEFNVMAVRIFHAHDLAARGQRRMQYLRPYRLKIGVAVSSVDDGMEIGMKRDRMSADRDSEIRRVGLARNFNPAERSPVFAGRGESSSNASKRTEIGIGESIISFDGSVARSHFVERAKLTSGLNVPDGLGVDEGGIETEGKAGADIFHSEIADIEHQRRLARAGRIDDELGVLTNELVDVDAHLSALTHVAHLLAVFLRRNVQAQATHMHGVYTHGFAE